jgi:predicted DNA-binding protein
MQGHYIETKVIHVSIPKPAHQQLQRLAAESGRTVPGYVRYLITQEFQRLDLPLYITINRKKRRGAYKNQ